MKIFVKIAVLFLFLGSLTACEAVFGVTTIEGVKRNFLNWYLADEKPNTVVDHTFVRYEQNEISSAQYFKSDGSVFLIEGGRPMVRAGTWQIVKSTLLDFKGDQLCMTFDDGKICQSYGDWAVRNISSYRTDFLRLASRTYAPCNLGNGSPIPRGKLIAILPDLNQDSRAAGELSCDEVWDSTFEEVYIGDNPNAYGDMVVERKRFFRCLYERPKGSLLIDSASVLAFNACTGNAIEPVGLERTQAFLAFDVAYRDLSVFSPKLLKRFEYD